MRKLTKTVVHKGNVYPAGTSESEIHDADKIGADVWDGSANPSEPAGYDAQTVKELEAEIDRRNEDRDPEGDSYLSKDGKKADLIAVLEADDEA